MSWTRPWNAAKVADCGGVTDNVVMFEARRQADENSSDRSTGGVRALNALSGHSDEALMVKIAQGDRLAARELMQRRLPRVLGMAQRMLNDPTEAEDIAQETFLRVWKAADRWEAGRAQVSTWIGRIAINLCYDRLRKRREILTDEPPDRPDTAPDQEVQLTRSETGNRVADAVAQLPERQRRALEMVHFQEMSNIKAAEIMEISVDALESLLARGRRKLKSILLEEAGELMSSYTTSALNESAER